MDTNFLEVEHLAMLGFFFLDGSIRLSEHSALLDFEIDKSEHGWRSVKCLVVHRSGLESIG